jgi:hypothetical protein
MTSPKGIGSTEQLGEPAIASVIISGGFHTGERVGAPAFSLAPLVYLNDEAPDDAEEVVAMWMLPVRPSSSIRLLRDPLPFTLVTHITGSENEQESLSEPVVSVHTLCDKTLGISAAKDECKKTHSRMLRLAKYVEDITLSSGRIVNVDYVEVTESPIWVPYGDDMILQKVGRYTLGLTYVAVPVFTTNTEAT